jgi:ligand-binding sensor domain-containing protein
MHLDMIASYLRKIAVAAAVSLLPFVGRAEGSQAAFSSNLSSRDVQAFAQDAQGYIWMGTSHGLNRYNGTNYTTFLASSEEGALKSNNILSLTVDSRGRL